jgi:hypothetical protein
MYQPHFKLAVRFSLVTLFLVVQGFLLEWFRPAALVYAADGEGKSEVLCLPGVYLTQPESCTLSGPSAYLTSLAQQGIHLPLQSLPAAPADPDLLYTPYQYARLKPGIDVPLYASLEDAIAGSRPAQYIEAGDLRYVSYIEEAHVNNSPKPNFFRLRSGAWISAQDVAQRERALIRYQGLSFNATPENAFGWILPLQAYLETKQTPGYAQDDYTGHQLMEYAVVQIYDSQVVDGIEWYLVGPNEWIEQRKIGRVVPMKDAPEGVTNGRWIEINLYEQTLAVYDQNQLVFATLVASGVEPFYTRPGLFPIYQKMDTTPMRGAFEADRSDFYYLEDVPWTMYFDEARAMHAAYWRTRFGFAQSHGCVNLSPGDAHWLFKWAQEGDWVYVWDPSGKTPTDPSLYTAGGA